MLNQAQSFLAFQSDGLHHGGFFLFIETCPTDFRRRHNIFKFLAANSVNFEPEYLELFNRLQQKRYFRQFLFIASNKNF